MHTKNIQLSTSSQNIHNYLSNKLATQLFGLILNNVARKGRIK